MKSIALSAIRFYQRTISPHKGFCCAYAAYSGRSSCSALGYRAIRRLGVWKGLGALDRRLEKCGVAARRGQAGALGRQGGFLDCGCDVGVLDLFGSACSCGPSDCSWKKRRASDDDQYVVIPSRGNVRR
ncbi:MAG: membrane protein insertion efficiency factor YidD [Pseudomonadota bacterium]